MSIAGYPAAAAALIVRLRGVRAGPRGRTITPRGQPRHLGLQRGRRHPRQARERAGARLSARRARDRRRLGRLGRRHRRDRARSTPAAACGWCARPSAAARPPASTATVPARSRGDIVVFSDANAMYQPDALLKLVRNFADPAVGCVTGEARYLDRRGARGRRRRARLLGLRDPDQAARDGARLDGRRRRRHLRDPPRAVAARCRDNAINDFLNPLQIVAAGWRAVYEPEAVCYEETAGGDPVRVPPPRPHRQPQLARGLPGARRAQSVPRRLLHLVARVAQDAALAVWRRSRWQRRRSGAVLLVALDADVAARPSASPSAVVLLLSTGTRGRAAAAVDGVYFAVINVGVDRRRHEGHSATSRACGRRPRQVAGATPALPAAPVGRIAPGCRRAAHGGGWCAALFRLPPGPVALVAFWGVRRDARVRVHGLPAAPGRPAPGCRAVPVRPRHRADGVPLHRRQRRGGR